MARTEGTYIQVAYKNVFGYISTNSWPLFMIQRLKIREKCAWVRSNTWRDETGLDRFFSVFQFFDKHRNWQPKKNSEFVQPQPVVRSFAVGFSLISVFFPVQRTGPANTTYRCKAHYSDWVEKEMNFFEVIFVTISWCKQSIGCTMNHLSQKAE